MATISPAAKLDGIVFTGDLVNKAKLVNLPHAGDVLQHLCTRLALDRKRLIPCHGNHDFVLNVANTRRYAEAISPIEKFFKPFGNRVTDCQTPLGVLHEIETGVHVLTLDSLLDAPAGDAGKPGMPSAHEDGVVEIVRQHVTSEDVLIIASHYPLDDFNEASSRIEERLWHGGRVLADRIGKLRAEATGPSLWLSGDLHYPLKPRSYGIFTCLLGGHFDGRPITKSLQKPAAVLFRVRAGSVNGDCVEVELRQGHAQQQSGGQWWCSERMPFPTVAARKKSKARVPTGTKPDTTPVRQLCDASQIAAGSPALASRVVAIERFEDCLEPITGGAPTLETQILDTIAQERLYHLGRFETAENQVSLGWVSIGPLLAGTPQHAIAFSSSPPLLPLVISQMQQWLKTKVDELNIPDDRSAVVLLGIDCWGAVISSQLSVMSGWRNFCIAGRGDGAHHTTFERVTPRVIREISAASLIVFVADVIASGHTIRHIHDDIMQKMPKGNGATKRKPNWLAAGVLCDELTERGSELDFLQSIGCACKVLRLPLITPKQLPDKHILPAILRFTGSKAAPQASATPPAIEKPDPADGGTRPHRSPIARRGPRKGSVANSKKSRR